MMQVYQWYGLGMGLCICIGMRIYIELRVGLDCLPLIFNSLFSQISKKICQLYTQCGNGETSEVHEFILSRLPAKPIEFQCVRQESLEDQVSVILKSILVRLDYNKCS